MSRSLTGCALVFVLLGSMAVAAGPTIAVIDLEDLVRLHPNTASDKKLLEQTLKEFTAQKEQLQEQLQNTRKAYEAAAKEADNPALGEKARQKLSEEASRKRGEAVAAEREYSETVRSLQRQLTDQEVRMLKRTTGEIEDVVAAYAKTNGLQLVLQLPGRKMGTVSGVLYADDALDITPAIMRQMGIKPQPEEPAQEDDEAGSPTGTRPAAQKSDKPAAPAGK
ncbi:MAG: OmpH family outer membrane protein [Kiritimatiellae bacterium]|nr:OmpH family outer membrane protein [Kiritimatiellia bacterium]